jgi:hypothetical protein
VSVHHQAICCGFYQVAQSLRVCGNDLQLPDRQPISQSMREVGNSQGVTGLTMTSSHSETYQMISVCSLAIIYCLGVSPASDLPDRQWFVASPRLPRARGFVEMVCSCLHDSLLVRA